MHRIFKQNLNDLLYHDRQIKSYRQFPRCQIVRKTAALCNEIDRSNKFDLCYYAKASKFVTA